MKPTKITELQGERLEKGRLSQDSIKKELEILELRRKNLELQKSLAQVSIQSIDSKMLNMANEISHSKRKQADLMVEHSKFIEELKKQYNVKGAFGYNPDTLEIIPNDEGS